MKAILNHLFENKTFSREQSKEILTNIAQGKYNNSQMAAFMTAYCMRSITVDELEGFRDAMLDLPILYLSKEASDRLLIPMDGVTPFGVRPILHEARIGKTGTVYSAGRICRRRIHVK